LPCSSEWPDIAELSAVTFVAGVADLCSASDIPAGTSFLLSSLLLEHEYNRADVDMEIRIKVFFIYKFLSEKYQP
jgi:hypothetical protein